MRVITKWEFDSYASTGENAVLICEDENSQLVLIVRVGGKDTGSIHTLRDQWGTFMDASGLGFNVAQEDRTRSFLDALINGLSHLKTLTFKCAPATVVACEEDPE